MSARLRGHGPALALILLAAAVLRTVAIGRESLWTDEALTLTIAHWPVREMATQPTDPTPFLYYALHKLLIPADAGAAAARNISLVAGLLSVPAIYALGRLALGRRGGLLAAALLGLSGPLIDYSQEARAYSLLVLLTILSATGLLWWRRADRPRDRRLALLLFVSATALAFYTHLVAIFPIALALSLLLSFASRARPSRVPEALSAAAALGLLAIPGLLRLARQAAIPDGFHWLPQATPAAFLTQTANAFLPTALWPAAAIPMLALAAALVTLALLRRPPDAPALAVILALLALPLLVWLFGFVARPIFMPRTVLFAIPGAILALSAALLTLRPPARDAATLALLAASLASAIAGGLSRDKEPWTAANAALAARVRPGDLILVCPNYVYPALRHAARTALPAPAILPYARRPLLIEDRFGSDPRWAEAVFDSLLAPNVRRFTRGERPSLPLRTLQGPVGTAWLVDAGCTPAARAALARAIGASAATPVWRGRPQPDVQPIEISRLPVEMPGPRALHVPR